MCLVVFFSIKVSLSLIHIYSAYGIMVHSVLSGRESSFYEPLEEVSLEEIPSKGTGYDFGIEISELSLIHI